MRKSIRPLRWVLLALYVAVIITLLVLGFASDDASTGWPMVLGFGVLVVSQGVFLLGAGTDDLCRPIGKRRLLAPIIAASLMGCILLVGLGLALAELFNVEDEGSAWMFWAALAASWAAWALLFYVHCRHVNRYTALKRMTAWLLAGSLVELLGSVPAHIIVSRRPGCMVGLGTGMGITAGVYVMLWAFGPGITLLFLRDRHLAVPKQRARTTR